MKKDREAIHAGTWYDGTEKALRARLSKWITARSADDGETALGIVAPHAGYMYSGEVAASVYNIIKIPKTVLILNPNHRGIGAPLALYPNGNWETPLGNVPIDSELNSLLLKNCPVTEDDKAHTYEHSGELQVPFLKFRRNDVSICAISISADEVETMQELGKGIAVSLKQFPRDALIVASSDLTHYEPQDAAEKKDKQAIAKIEALDPDGLWETVLRERITMCGVAPVSAMLFAAKELGAKSARLIKYRTSGDVTGDYDQVVGYGSLLIKRP